MQDVPFTVVVGSFRRINEINRFQNLMKRSKLFWNQTTRGLFSYFQCHEIIFCETRKLIAFLTFLLTFLTPFTPWGKIFPILESEAFSILKTASSKILSALYLLLRSLVCNKQCRAVYKLWLGFIFISPWTIVFVI